MALQQRVHCAQHGEQDMAIACIHICRAFGSGERVGFFWSTDTSGPRPDAWCWNCEQWNLANPEAPLKEWMRVANFQFLCVRCWDEAKAAQIGVTKGSEG